MLDQILYPAIEPYEKGFLKVSDLHTLYYEQCGNPNGRPVIVIHGGPGAGCSLNDRRFFDPQVYRIILLDQRGAGRSQPTFEMQENTTQLLIEDFEMLRKKLAVEKWVLFGGSWGSSLALAYAQAYPESAIGLILRGIWLVRKADVDWFFNGASKVFPDNYEALKNFLPAEEQSNLLVSYYNRLMNPDPKIHLPAGRAFTRYELASASLLPNPRLEGLLSNDTLALGLAKTECFYMMNDCFIREGQLLEEVSKITHLPGYLVHGRYDMVCPMEGAYLLHKAWPGSHLEIIPDAGHSSLELGIAKALVEGAKHMASI